MNDGIVVHGVRRSMFPMGRPIISTQVSDSFLHSLSDNGERRGINILHFAICNCVAN